MQLSDGNIKQANTYRIYIRSV